MEHFEPGQDAEYIEGASQFGKRILGTEKEKKMNLGFKNEESRREFKDLASNSKRWKLSIVEYGENKFQVDYRKFKH